MPTRVMVCPLLPEAAQTPAGPALKVTGVPEPPPVALTVKGASPSRWLGSGPKLMACDAWVMVSVPAT